VPTLRGLASARTLIVLDEGRVTAERRAGPSASFLDIATVDELEVVRGPGSVAYGSDAFGGIIRARTHIPGPGEKTEVSYELSAVDNGQGRSAAAEVGGDVLGGGALLGASYRSSENYESPEGEVADSESELKGFRLGYQHELAGGLLRVIWRTDLGRDLGKPSSESNLARTWYPEDNSNRATASWERGGVAGFSRLSVTTTWDSYELLTNKLTYATSSKAAQLSEADVLANDYGVRLEGERPLGPARLVLGIDANGRYGLEAVNWYTAMSGTNPPRVREDSIENAQHDDLGAYAGVNAAWDPLALGAGLRVDQVRSRNTGGYFGDHSTSNSALSGFLAATVTLAPGIEAAAQASRGFRDPLLSDRYYRGISGRGFITGNPDLDPETSLQYDVSFRMTRETFTLAAYGYLYRIEDLIERYKSGANYYFRNRGEAEVKGVEVEASLALPAGMQATLGLQSLRGEVLDDGTAMDTIPPEGAVLTLRRDPSKTWWWLARVATYREDDRPGPTEKDTPGYTVVDAGVGYRVGRALELQLLGRNLTDRAYYGTADSTAVLAPGRSVQLSLRGRI
jgi:outer membrane receptor protein involved in Fe transport